MIYDPARLQTVGVIYWTIVADINNGSDSCFITPGRAPLLCKTFGVMPLISLSERLHSPENATYHATDWDNGLPLDQIFHCPLSVSCQVLQLPTHRETRVNMSSKKVRNEPGKDVISGRSVDQSVGCGGRENHTLQQFAWLSYNDRGYGGSGFRHLVNLFSALDAQIFVLCCCLTAASPRFFDQGNIDWCSGIRNISTNFAIAQLLISTALPQKLGNFVHLIRPSYGVRLSSYQKHRDLQATPDLPPW